MFLKKLTSSVKLDDQYEIIPQNSKNGIIEHASSSLMSPERFRLSSFFLNVNKRSSDFL